MDTSSENPFILYLKTGRSGSGRSACPCCHHAYMLALYKASEGHCHISVEYVNSNKPPQDLKQIAKRLPALADPEVDPTEAAAEYDEMMDIFEERVLKPSLCPEDVDALEATIDLFSKFCFFLRNLAQTPQHLEAELYRVNAFLARHGEDRKFLCGDTISDLDCQIMSKLHQIRVACSALKKYEIPPKFGYVWRYLATAYDNSFFRDSCPSDEEIIYHCGQKMEGKKNLPKEVQNIINNTLGSRELETYTFSVPSLITE